MPVIRREIGGVSGDGGIGISQYLLPADDGAGLALDDHVLGGAEEEAGRGQEPGLVEVLHDVGHLLRLELEDGSPSCARRQKQETACQPPYVTDPIGAGRARTNKEGTNEQRRAHRRERGALGPDGAVVADDGGGGEVVALDLAHEVLVDVRLPRHLAARSAATRRPARGG